MQRYFTDQILKIGETYQAPETDIHHMKNVMRFKAEDHFHMVDGTRTTYLCEVTGEGGDIEFRTVERVDETPELPVDVTVYCPLLKGEKFEWMIQKSTELGAHDFRIYDAERSIVRLNDKKREKRIERFEKIIKEASEQSRRQRIPEIGFDGPVGNLDLEPYDRVLFAYEGNAGDSSSGMKSVLQNIRRGERIAFIFGPEGGFGDAEVEVLDRYDSVRLGARILRAETSPLYALSSVSFQFEEPAPH